MSHVFDLGVGLTLIGFKRKREIAKGYPGALRGGRVGYNWLIRG
jgi:hypothetical protein